MFAGLILAAGFVTLTAFGGKTLEQQKQEIAAAITAQLDEYRAQKQEECTTRVNEEAQRRYDEFLAAQPATPAVAPKPGVKKRSNTSTTKKDPMPQTAPQDPQKTRGGAVQEGNVEQQKTRSGAAPVTSDPVKAAEDQKKRPGASKQGGGN